jgi:hypothetical protein
MRLVLNTDEDLQEQLSAAICSLNYLPQPGSVYSVRIGRHNYAVIRTQSGIEVYATDHAVPNANRYLDEGS